MKHIESSKEYAIGKLFGYEEIDASNDIIAELQNVDDIDKKWMFLVGVLESTGTVYEHGQRDKYAAFPACTIRKTGIEKTLDDIGIPYVHNDRHGIAFYTGTNAIDFLGRIFKYQTNHTSQKYKEYVHLLTNSYTDFPVCKVIKTDEDAIIPCKTNESDVGYDLTIIKRVKDLTTNVILFDTGIKMVLPNKFYGEIVPRSSLSKSGYMLANNVGIIDRSYTGNLYIALVKINHLMPDLTLPFRCCQLILRRQYYMKIEETTEQAETTRGQGGFGSTS